MRGKLAVVQGMAIAEPIAENWEQIWNFQARDGDVLLDTYPKSGTTWMQEVIDLIMHDADEQICRRAPIYERIPFIELMHLMKPGVEEVNAMPSPRVLKTHLPIQLVPPSFWEHNCKVIYVARNARDTVNSFYYFDQAVQMHPDPVSWENFLERFMKGDVGWGSWYEHVKGFWEQKDKHNMLYVFFEDMKKTPVQEIRRVAQFLGKDLSDDVINKIAKLTTFEHMKNNPMANYSDFPKHLIDQTQSVFMRKGVEEVNAMPSPRVLKSHLPIQLVPPSFWEHNCKVIYVARNARDTVNSFYYFDQTVQIHPDPVSWDSFLERFMKGDVAWGSWYEHVKGFWEQKDKRNMLYVFFEDMKKTPLQEIRRVAQFLGKDLSDDVINKIAKLTTFEHMKNNPMANYSDFPKYLIDQSQGDFMRKGTVGDWKTLFMAQQSEAFEEHYKKMMSGCTLKFQDPK
ncbi:sulfotransferase 1 family member D1-like isoform X2 [Pseudophryne corroboree]|uniref:sulfotransferase 1 family member D1-like isoform X2 n=1 Tax=Pseudophryne corroboree TaxID=495146 RepID=UPI003082186B